MKILFFIYQWFIAAPIMLVATIITAIVTMVGCLFDSNYWGYYPAKWWSRLWCAIHFVRIKVQGREKVDRETSYVFVANHQGAYDIFTVYGYLGHPFKWMMRKGITNIPLVGTACRAAGHILVDTKSAGGLRHTIEDAEKKLGKGMSLVVFPEGRRTDTGKMGVFKPGAFRLALEFGLPIVPITIDGSYRVMPRNTFNVTPGTITLTLHEPIAPEICDNDPDQVSRKARAAIESSLS
ncbi:MAG: 1-acyl-sn-glycerol-3-phosphate acyltransferase [Muribaculaceae bacterium]|nr:1-acyl-sn-glycerol-3-phosphate acyltransferase [Muribaculaceae bacterium]